MATLEKNIVSKAAVNKIGIPQSKMKLAIDRLRGKNVVLALAVLKNTRRRANSYLIDLLNSAMANALSKDKKIKPEQLYVSTIYSNQGQSLKRMLPRAFGRGSAILKRSCHVYVELGLNEKKAPNLPAAKKAEQTAKTTKKEKVTSKPKNNKE